MNDATKDIFTKIAERDSAPKAVKPKRCKLYAIHFGDGGRATCRLYPYAKARQIVTRANRLGLDVYIAGSVLVSK